MSTFKYSIGILLVATAISSTVGVAQAGEGPHERNGQNVFERKAEQRAEKERMKLAKEIKAQQEAKTEMKSDS